MARSYNIVYNEVVRFVSIFIALDTVFSWELSKMMYLLLCTRIYVMELRFMAWQYLLFLLK